MSKYKIKGTNILHNKIVYAEGSEIELDDKQAKKLQDYLELIESTLRISRGKSKQKQVQTTEPIKQEEKQEQENKTPEKKVQITPPRNMREE